ncbi:MAG: serine/threonine-protein kinase [Myxococcota bacterium]
MAAERFADEARTWVGREVGPDGRYAISSVLGVGAQAITLEAIDKRDGTLVALKRYAVRGARSWKDVELAEREAEVLLALDHDLVVRARDRFEGEGGLYLVMDKVDGESLDRLDRLSPDELTDLVEDFTSILGYLHQQRPPVVHRDIKPGNIVRRPPRPGEKRAHFVLVDFGSVRHRLQNTGGSTVVGTYGYMAPEQLQGRALPETDIYGLGATLLRLITGREPEELPHRGLSIDVGAALGSNGGPAWQTVLQEMVAPDPELRRASLVGISERLRPRRAPRTDFSRRPQGGGSKRSPGLWDDLGPALATTALSLARVAVGLSLRALVPGLLAGLAVVFGPSLRRAAERIRALGDRTDDALAAAQARVAHGERPTPSKTMSQGAQPPQVRIETEPQRKKRVDLSGLERTLEDVSHIVEQTVEEVQEELREAKKRFRL